MRLYQYLHYRLNAWERQLKVIYYAGVHECALGWVRAVPCRATRGREARCGRAAGTC